MESDQERVISEKMELEDKVQALQAFIQTNSKFRELPDDEQHRRIRQLQVMSEYLAILKERIAKF